jgi:hypothetical protein
MEGFHLMTEMFHYCLFSMENVLWFNYIISRIKTKYFLGNLSTVGFEGNIRHSWLLENLLIPSINMAGKVKL